MQSLFVAIGLLLATVQPMRALAQADARPQLRPYSYYEGPLGTATAPATPAAPECKDEKEKVKVKEKEKVVYYTPGTYWTPSYYSQYYYPQTYVAAAPVTYYYGAPAAYSYGVLTVGPRAMPEGYITKATIEVKVPAAVATVPAPATVAAPAIVAAPATVPAPTTYYYGSFPGTTYSYPAYIYVRP